MYAWYTHERELVVTKYPNLISDHSVTEATSRNTTVFGPDITVEGEYVSLLPDYCTIYDGVLYVIVRDQRSPDNVGSFLCKKNISSEVSDV